MESVDDKKPWAVDRDRRSYGLRVVLPKKAYVLPWAQFLYAEGALDTVRAVFSMHDVVVTGCGLNALLADVAAQVVTVLQQPPRSENFAPTVGPRVVAGEVRRIEGSGPRDRRCRKAWVCALTGRSVSTATISRPSASNR
jgi:hypothetical protein